MKAPIILAVTGALVLLPAASAKKKKEVTQTLASLPEPPPAVAADTRRLVFHTSPLSARGLLSQQTRDAVREILRQSGGMPVIKIRAFVAGTGDLRRVPQIVSEEFSERKHLSLPAITVLQAGGLPLEGAQVVLESVSESKREVNPQGILFISTPERSVNQPLQSLAQFGEESVDEVAARLAGRGEALQVSCFATSLDEAAQLRSRMAAKFPNAALDVVQTQRAAARSSVSCEAIARSLSSSVAGDGAPLLSNRVVFTTAQVAFGFKEDDARLAFQRMNKVLAPFGASLKTAAEINLYPLSASIASQASRLLPEFLDAARLPVKAATRFEGLPGMDASFAIDAVAPATAGGPRGQP